jgi:NAD(P)-dependent dehydrogenase (short-subunit alcohol dehydrogenase family)
MIGLTRSVALDFGPLGIRCNAVSPGSIETPMLKSFNDANPGARAAQLAKSYVGRLGEPRDVAEACIHFLSDRAPFTNGAELIVDGGMTAALL